jgi:hypothetical protein
VGTHERDETRECPGMVPDARVEPAIKVIFI